MTKKDQQLIWEALTNQKQKNINESTFNSGNNVNNFILPNEIKEVLPELIDAHFEHGKDIQLSIDQIMTDLTEWGIIDDVFPDIVSDDGEYNIELEQRIRNAVEKLVKQMTNIQESTFGGNDLEYLMTSISENLVDEIGDKTLSDLASFLEEADSLRIIKFIRILFQDVRDEQLGRPKRSNNDDEDYINAAMDARDKDLGI